MDYFGDALSLIDKLGIKDIITYKTDFDPTVVAQFYVTVHFSPDAERSIVWMTGSKKMTALHEFMQFLHIDFQGADTPLGLRPHAAAPAKDRLQKLYLRKGVLPKHLDIMHRIFRNTLFPRSGQDEDFSYAVKGQDADVAQKESRQRHKRVLRTLDVDISSGSKDDITPETTWMQAQGYQWSGYEAEEEEQTD
ncbi:hypothetical protein ZWY2020_016019 [Hordeum vulgare]|nr:hypothetical protein ZWY2020_016019 [Hordeum vulgare]